MDRCITGLILLLALWGCAGEVCYRKKNWDTSGYFDDSRIGDGWCDKGLNTDFYFYDGGDCCQCTCCDAAYKCGDGGYACLDPNASNIFFNCEEPPTIRPSCGLEEEWISVHDTSTALDLAKSVSCSGGTFYVTWEGTVAVEKTIYVANRTFLNVTGVGAEAIADGRNSTRPFALFNNASLVVSNVNFRYGHALVGGAIAVVEADASFDRTGFVGNNASYRGGAIWAEDSTLAFFSETKFHSNYAGKDGGALNLKEGSRARWEGNMTFENNIAGDDGGAVSLWAADVSWQGTTQFVGNVAATETDDGEGGGMRVRKGSNVRWTSSNSLFGDNKAFVGGAMFVEDDSTVTWTQPTVTNFTSNAAERDGGALGSKAYDSTSVYKQNSSLVASGPTTFSNNTCEGSGGGMALLGMLDISLSSEIVFDGNFARSGGGAVFISSTGYGPEFVKVRFKSNVADTGGAVYVRGSGTTPTYEGREQYDNPTTFDGCIFTSNTAMGSGGAVDSAAGLDWYNNSVFMNNMATVGGALRLAGEARVEYCLFEDNISGPDQGSAVFNFGGNLFMRDDNFVDNMLSCDNGSFLSFVEAAAYNTVCKECPESCEGCRLTRQELPICVSLSEGGILNAASRGGVTTVEGLEISKGFWRATNTSTNVLECYNPDACLGGKDTGRCHDGYEGPYCSICIRGHFARPGFRCEECSHGTWSMLLAGGLVVVTFFVTIAVVFHLISGEKEGTGRGIVDGIARYVPLQAVKIVIVAWQIVTQFSSAANVTYPGVYQDVLDAMDVLNFDLGWMLSMGCVTDIDFHGRLLITTIWPFIVLAFLGVTYIVANLKNGGSQDSLKQIRDKHVSMVLLLAFFVFSSVSSMLFLMFDCEALDDERKYLRADYSIDCSSERHQALTFYSYLMIVVYPVGIPAFYATLLFWNRRVLEDGATRDKSPLVKSISHLWEPYKPSRFFFEVVECGRRILLAGVIVLGDGNAAQIAVTLMISFLFAMILEALAPYESWWDTWISRIGHAVVYSNMFLALLLKINVSHETHTSQERFGCLLVAAHALMVLVVVAEAVMMAWASRANTEREDPLPRRHNLSAFRTARETPRRFG